MLFRSFTLFSRCKWATANGHRSMVDMVQSLDTNPRQGRCSFFCSGLGSITISPSFCSDECIFAQVRGELAATARGQPAAVIPQSSQFSFFARADDHPGHAASASVCWPPQPLVSHRVRALCGAQPLRSVATRPMQCSRRQPPASSASKPHTSSLQSSMPPSRPSSPRNSPVLQPQG